MPYTLRKGTEVFHGTFWDIKEKEYHTSLEVFYGDFDVIWITTEEFIAEKFAKDSASSPIKKEQILIVMKGELLEDINLFIMEQDKFILNYEGEEEYVHYKEFMDEKDIHDVRELFHYLDKQKYDGTISYGSIGTHTYDDIALFDGNLINFNEFKYFNRKKDSFSKWMNKDEILEKLKFIDLIVLKGKRFFSKTFYIK